VYICRQGESDEDALYLLEGEIETLTSGVKIRDIRTGTDDSFFPLAPGDPRPVSIRSRDHTTIFRIALSALDDIESEAAASSEALDREGPGDAQSANEVPVELVEQSAEPESVEPHASGGDWQQDLLTTKLFRRIPSANVPKILELLELVEVHAGDVIVREGTPGDYFFYIRSGLCEVTRQARANAPYVKLAEIGSGMSFGEEALVSDSPRNATVTMLTDGVLMRLSKSDFVQLIREPTLKALSYTEAQDRITEGGCWVDVRYPEDFEESGIAGSINIPPSELRDAIDTLDRAKPYICYCDTGRESAAAAFLLAEAGFNVSYLKGGLIHAINALRLAKLKTIGANQTLDVKTDVQTESDTPTDQGSAADQVPDGEADDETPAIVVDWEESDWDADDDELTIDESPLGGEEAAAPELTERAPPNTEATPEAHTFAQVPPSGDQLISEFEEFLSESNTSNDGGEQATFVQSPNFDIPSSRPMSSGNHMPSPFPIQRPPTRTRFLLPIQRRTPCAQARVTAWKPSMTTIGCRSTPMRLI
jgi:CRP-like cAMP-binding protein